MAASVASRTDEAFVLDTRELGETDLIVTLLTEQAGRIRGVAKGARRSRKRFGGALAPWTRARASWVESGGRELHRIESLEASRSFAVMQSEPSVQAACAVLAEVTAATTRENQAEPRLFRLLGAVLEGLASGLDPCVAVRYFEFWLLRLHGVLSDLDACAACGEEVGPRATRWASARGDLLCSRCARTTAQSAFRLGARDAAMLHDFARRPPRELGTYADRARPGGTVERFLRGGVEAFAERTFNTYRHLRTHTP